MPTGTLGLRLRRIITPARVRLAIDLKLEWTSGSTTELTRRHGALSPSAMAVTGTLRFYKRQRPAILDKGEPCRSAQQSCLDNTPATETANRRTPGAAAQVPPAYGRWLARAS